MTKLNNSQLTLDEILEILQDELEERQENCAEQELNFNDTEN